MDENVIYDNNQQNPPADQSVPEAAPQQPPPDQSGGDVPPQQPPAEEAAQTPPPPAGGKKKLWLILGGIFLLFFVILIVFMMIPKKTAPKAVKLVWWGLWEESSVMQRVITDFHKQYPYITVEYSKQDSNNYREKLLGRIKNGTGPDIFRYHNSWYPMLTDVLTALPPEVITPEDFKKVYYPVISQDLIRNGGIYGIPLGADSLALFINTDMLEAAGRPVPKTWIEFRDTAKILTVPESNDASKIKTAGAALGTYDNVTHAPDIISLFLVQQGINPNVEEFSTADPSSQQSAISFYTSYAKELPHVWDNSQDPSVLAFARGKLAMYFGYSWDVFTILSQPTAEKLNFKIYPVPGNEGASNTTIASYWVEGVSAGSPNKNAALLFMNYLAQKETAQKFYNDSAKVRKFGEPYARRDLAETLKDNELVYPFEKGLEDASSTFFSSDTHDGNSGLNFLSNEQMQNVINAIIINGDTPETAVKTLDDGIAQVFTNGGYGQQQ